MLNICLKSKKKVELRGRIYEVVVSERFERMDILSGQNTESVNFYFFYSFRDRLLHQLMIPLQRCPVTGHMYDESSFFRDPQLIRDLIKVLSSLADFPIVLEQSLTRGIDR